MITRGRNVIHVNVISRGNHLQQICEFKVLYNCSARILDKGKREEHIKSLDMELVFPTRLDPSHRHPALSPPVLGLRPKSTNTHLNRKSKNVQQTIPGSWSCNLPCCRRRCIRGGWKWLSYMLLFLDVPDPWRVARGQRPWNRKRKHGIRSYNSLVS